MFDWFALQWKILVSLDRQYGNQTKHRILMRVLRLLQEYGYSGLFSDMD